MGTIYKYLDALRTREYPYRILQTKLKTYRIDSARSWALLLQKHLQDPADIILTQRWASELHECYLDHIRYGKRAVAVFDVESDLIQLLIRALPNLIDQSSAYRSEFPLPISIENLTEQGYSSIGTAVESEGDVVRLTYCVKRYVKTREDVNFLELDEGVRSALSKYDELIGVRRGNVQGFDSLVLYPRLNKIEIHVDISCGLSGNEISLALSFYRLKVENLAMNVLGVNNILSGQRNFFPLIQGLYDAADGCVASLGHSTGSASIKDEHMRRKNADLRTEPFHAGGLLGINNITSPYLITKTWPGFMSGTIPSVTIPGHFSMAGNQHAKIGYAIIDNCTCEADFDLVMSKLQ